MSQNRSVPEERRALLALPARAEEGMTRRQQQMIFEQVKGQVLDTAIRYFDLSLRIVKQWLDSDERNGNHR